MIEYTVKDRNALCEIINLQEGISRFAGKESLYFKSLLKFINDYRDVPSPENEEEYRRYAHTVKGLSGNLGFKKLYELTQAFNANPYDFGIRDASIAEFDRAIAIIKENVFESNNAPAPSVKKGTKQQLLEELRLLEKALSEFLITDCERIAERIQSYQWEVEVDLKGVFDAIKDYELFDAQTMLDDILSELL